MHAMTTRIIVASHGDLACALMRAVELIAGPQDELHCLSLATGEDVAAFSARLAVLTDTHHPCLVLVDMAGGTPWNVALAQPRLHTQVRVVSGVNLPMLLEVALGRNHHSIDKLANLALEAGTQSVQLGALSQ
jgi:mannose PTS system EIIA component